MGKADQLAKRIFTEETPTATGHCVQFMVPPEVPVGALQPDGLLLLVATNELPLRADLVPFLVARSGRALIEFAAWALVVKGPDWVVDVVKNLPMAQQVLDEIVPVSDDPEEQHRLKVAITRKLLSLYPEAANDIRNEAAEEGFALLNQFEQKLSRPLTLAERGELVRRIKALGTTRIREATLAMGPTELASWLADQNAT